MRRAGQAAVRDGRGQPRPRLRHGRGGPGAARWRSRPGWSRPARPSRAARRVYADLNWAWDPEWLVAHQRHARARADEGRPSGAGPCAGRRRCRGRAGSDAVGRPLRGWLARADRRRHAPISAIASCSKRDRPFVMRLDPADPEPVERAAYDASYKGVTDIADALSVAPARLLPDPLGGAGRDDARTWSRRSAQRCAWPPSSCS